MNELGQRIERIVTNSDKSFRAFALEVHIDPGMLHRVMHGKSHLSRQMAAKLIARHPELADVVTKYLLAP